MKDDYIVSDNREYYIENIKSKLPQDVILCQLAEELSEAAQAALKMVRIIGGINPTIISAEKAKKELISEIADVNACIRCIDWKEYPISIMSSEITRKIKRWSDRLDGLTDK